MDSVKGGIPILRTAAFRCRKPFPLTCSMINLILPKDRNA